MAIYGIGASYGGNTDVSSKFRAKGLACVGWGDKDAQPLHAMLKHFKIGDIVYIKAHPPQVGLIIKAVGVVVSDEQKKDKELGTGVPVKWLWHGEVRLGKFDDKYPVRNITLYEEFSRVVQSRVVELLLWGCRNQSRAGHERFLYPKKRRGEGTRARPARLRHRQFLTG
jgi:hypothetical protein